MQQINWKVGITSEGEVFISFSDGKESARFSMDADTADRISTALHDAAIRHGEKQATGARKVYDRLLKLTGKAN